MQIYPAHKKEKFTMYAMPSKFARIERSKKIKSTEENSQSIQIIAELRQTLDKAEY
jgi:hypothetical protein